MDFYNSSFQISGTLLTYGAVLSLLSFILWLLIRAQPKRVFFPILKVLDIENRQRPRYRLSVPPIVPFLCFILSSLVIVFFIIKPQKKFFSPLSSQQERVHIFIDLSPSVSRFLSPEAYVEKVNSLWSFLQKEKSVTLSTSRSRNVFQLKAETVQQVIEDQILKEGFHRTGIKIGSAIQSQKEFYGKIDKFFIFSDGDQASWMDFNWKSLLNETAVYWINLRSSNHSSSKENLFFLHANLLPKDASGPWEWDIGIERRGDISADRKGTLTLSYKDKELGSFPWSLEPEKKNLALRVKLSPEKMNALQRDTNPLVWSLGDLEEDAIALDNTFRTALVPSQRSILIVGGLAGESMLENPSYSFATALDVLGFAPVRHDGLSTFFSESINKREVPLISLWFSDTQAAEDICPISFVQKQLKQTMDSSSKGAESLEKKIPALWLIPSEGVASEYKNICTCSLQILQMATDQRDTSLNPVFCEQVYDRKSLGYVLNALGAEQLGGSMSDSSRSVAWKKKLGPLELSLFTVPLRPMRAYGLSHADFPLILQDLLQAQGFLSYQKTQLEDWPRIADRSQELIWKQEQPTAEEQLRIKTSNVPLGESLLVDFPENDLPNRLNFDLDPQSMRQDLSNQTEEKKDAWAWIRLGSFLLVAAAVFEALWFSIRYLRRKSSSVVLLLFLLSFLKAGKLQAEITIGFAGQKSNLKMWKLAQTVQQRTSLEMTGEILTSEKISEDLLAQPWLWIDSPELVTNQEGSLRKDVALWLRRGGFLVITSSFEAEKAKKMLQGWNSSKEDQSSLWKAVPLDHELMRSFYLLNNLPSCEGVQWNSFSFDSRLAILWIPHHFLSDLADEVPTMKSPSHGSLDFGQGGKSERGVSISKADSLSRSSCFSGIEWEQKTRIFINILMVALSTDYKKDQIHMREILKRLN